MTEQVIFETPWIKVKRTPKGFDYLERKGRDSIAVALLRRTMDGYEVLVRWQPLCVHNADIDEEMKLYPCLITGGIEEDETPQDSALREIEEEAGFKVLPIDLRQLATYIAGTQTNETVYVYVVDVTEYEQEEALQDGSYFESISRNQWCPLNFLSQCDYVACQLAYYLLKV